jgi:diaminohydroxyphosphoribosylaminopyrimidine deaminase/5-amino-6-(5-phosphoribosylamino)uracil reductase
VIAAGIIRVVAAMKDPFDKVAGQGFLRLQSAGIAVDVAVLEHEARSLNAPYLKLLSSGCPYVHAKWAMTMDGKIATKTGESKWITGEEARRAAHDLRGRMDAIIVGIETVLTDDPSLTARPPGARTATRVVLDSSGRLPIRSQLVQTARHTPVLVVTTDQARQDQLESLRGLGCECLVMPRCEGGVRLMPFLQELGRRRFTNVLVEGGSRVLGSFHDARAIDELHTFVAGKTLGGQGITPVSGEGVSCVGDASLFVIAEVRQIGNDCLIRAYRQQP